jgi:hypothetical protein
MSDLYPDDVEVAVVAAPAKPSEGLRTTVKAALTAATRTKDGKGKVVASSDAWEACQKVAPGFPMSEFEICCKELQSAWDVKKKAAVEAVEGKVEEKP